MIDQMNKITIIPFVYFLFFIFFLSRESFFLCRTSSSPWASARSRDSRSRSRGQLRDTAAPAHPQCLGSEIRRRPCGRSAFPAVVPVRWHPCCHLLPRPIPELDGSPAPQKTTPRRVASQRAALQRLRSQPRRLRPWRAELRQAGPPAGDAPARRVPGGHSPANRAPAMALRWPCPRRPHPIASLSVRACSVSLPLSLGQKLSFVHNGIHLGKMKLG
jgi:hypothetical protein